MKESLRTYFRTLRKDLRNRSRDLSPLFHAVGSCRKVLSFTPMGSELDISPLNEFLALQGRLLLVPNSPDPFQLAEGIDLILVPGLAFDPDGYRLGQGSGFYDRLLSKVPEIPTLGVGFKEQLSSGQLPRDPWDRPVRSLCLL